MKRNHPKSLGCSDSRRNVYGNTGQPQEERKISNKQPNLTHKEARNRRNGTPTQQKKGNKKIRTEINDTQT